MGDGLKTAVELAMAEAPATGPAQPEQLALLPGAEGEARPAHRPAGARNKATQHYRDLVLSKHTSPLLVLARFYDEDTKELARRLQCKPLEAAEFQRKCAEGVLPYVHGKMPVEDANGNAVLPILQLVDPRQAMAAFGAEMGGPLLDLSALEMADFSHSSDAVAGAVGQAELDGGAEGQEIRASQPAEPLIEDQP